MNFYQIDQLDYGIFLLYRRDAYISALNRSEDGREYLKECRRLEQTEADRSGLRELSGQGGTLWEVNH